MLTVRNGGPSQSLAEAVFLSFDDHSIPLMSGLRLQLVSGKVPGQKNPIVVGRGEPGRPDDARVRFYGTVIPLDGKLRMWYLAQGSQDQPERDGSQLRVCYAESEDGVSWRKPELGLVDYHGSRRNNIVAIRDGRCDFAAFPVLHDPEDPDPKRRYKTVFESHVYGNRISVAFSPDGLSWTESPANPLGPTLEQTGLVRFGGFYYVNGQGGAHFGPDRKLATFCSYDFNEWSQASCMGFRRGTIPPCQMATEWNAGEEVHLGAGLWNRGNVLVGVYDMWHGHPSSDRSMVGMDLGLVFSVDALHYREPIPDFRFVPAYEEIGAQRGKPPVLSHGQGLLSVGEKTFLWYEAWGDPGDVRLARWDRDRLGYLQVFKPVPDAHIVTCPIDTDARCSVHVNAEVPEHAELRLEVLDAQMRPVPTHSGENCCRIRESGLRMKTRWGKSEEIPAALRSFRLKAGFGGVRPEDAKLYAVYVTTGG
jgi:hypothetical protein